MQIQLANIHRQKDFFIMQLCLDLYDICKDLFYPELSPLDFLNFLNLRYLEFKVGVCSQKKSRVFYLIYLLKKNIIKDIGVSSEDWTNNILMNLGLDRNDFDKHHKNIINNASSTGGSSKFIKHINTIFGEEEL